MSYPRLARIMTCVFVLALAAACTGRSQCKPLAGVDQESEKQAILALISRMEAAWNRGDFRGYMEGFANPDVVFVSRGEFQRDWQGTLDHYIRDYGASADTLGRLHFFDIRIELLAPDAAQLISRYSLDRPQRPQDGINTRLLRKRDGKWVIALNHVSSREMRKITSTCTTSSWITSSGSDQATWLFRASRAAPGLRDRHRRSEKACF